MASSMNLSLTNELRDFVNTRAGNTGLYATPSEYLRDLIRRDMQSQDVVVHVMDGLNDLKHGRFSDKSILDIAEED
ncbi:MAG: antitoxin ParD1/3/4 [Candidatus Endobugula sp.]|jgi:antitoxin ParD1/3/4